MGQTAHTQAKESVMATQVSLCEGAEEKKKKRVELPGGKLRGTKSFQTMQGMGVTSWL